MRKLPSRDIPLTAGANTNFDPESQALQTFALLQNMDTFQKFRALGKMPGSTKITTNALGATVRSIHQYTYTSLSAVRTRKQLAAAGAALYNITSGGATSLWSSPALYLEPLVSCQMQNRIFLTSENQRTLVTGGIKFDGDNARRWGVVRPGEEPTVRNALDSHSGWTASTDVTLSTEATNTRDGGGSVSVAKTGTTTTTGYFEKASLALNFGTHVQAYVWLYLPPGTLQKLATSGTAVEVQLGGASLTNSDKHSFSIGELVSGWNLLSLALDAPDSETGTGAVLSAVDTVRFTVNFSGTSQVQSGILWDAFYSVDLGKPTAAVNTTGLVDDTVTYRVTFLTEYGVESNAGGASNSVVPVSAAATGTLTVSLTPSDGDTVTIGTTVYTFKTALTPTAYQVLIGGSVAVACANLEDAINATGDIGTSYASGTLAHPSVTATSTSTTVVVTATTVGTGGNSIASTETGAQLAWGATTLASGRAGQTVDLTALPVSADAQVIARRIYRDSQADRVYRFVDQVDDNVTTTFTDNIAAASLGEATMPIAGDDLLDSSPPERMRAVAVHDNRVFGISGDDANIILVSDIGAPEQFRIIDQLTVDEELVGLRSHALGLVLYGKTRALLLTGDGVNAPFRVDNLNSELGANNPQCIVDVLGMNIVLRNEELYHVADPRDSWLLNGPVLDQFRAASSSQLATAWLTHDAARYRVLCWINSAIWYYQYGTIGTQEVTGDGPGIGPKDLRIGTWGTISLPVTATCAELCEESANKPEVWFGASDGHVYQLQDTSVTNYANGASTAAIDADCTTHAIPLGPDDGAGGAPNGRGEPRYILLNSDSTAGITWSATVSILSDADGSVIGSSTFDIVCPAGKAAVITAIPGAGSISGWCKVRLRNNTASTEGVIRGLRLFYIPRGAFRGTQAS